MQPNRNSKQLLFHGSTGPAAAHGGKATPGSWDMASGSSLPIAWALQTQDWTLHLQQLVTILQDWLMDAKAWWAEDIAQEDA